MGLFSKNTCEICNKQSRLEVWELKGSDKVHFICEDCMSKMHIKGLFDWRSRFFQWSDKISYNELMQYSEYYKSIEEGLEYNAKPITDDVNDICTDLSSAMINSKFICFCDFKDLIIRMEDVVAVAIDRVSKLSDTFKETFMVTVYTNNPFIPFCVFDVTAKVSFFSFSTKAKKARESVIQMFKVCCPNLKYEITNSSKLKKAIKADTNYTWNYDKKLLLSTISDACYNMGGFSTKYFENIVYDGYIEAQKLNIKKGYTIA